MSKNENHITLILLGVIIIFLIIIISNRLCNKKNNNVETFEDNETENSGVKLLNLYNDIQNQIDTYNDETNKIDSDISELNNLVSKFIKEVNLIKTFTDFKNYKNLLSNVFTSDNNFSKLKKAMIEYIDKKEDELKNKNSKDNQKMLDLAIDNIIQQINSDLSIQS